jgi:2-C-methyl-D-erythritol 4-phosphate cytidylyltransferase
VIGGKRVCAVIPAAGGGTRMGAGVSKILIPLGGVPVLVRTLRNFERTMEVDDVVLALRPEDAGRTEELIASAGIRKVRRIVHGGAERQDSVRIGLGAASAAGADVVVVHDGARPFAGPGLIGRVAEAAHESGAAVAAVRPKDTVKTEGEPGLLETPDRARCWLAQTPQAFRTELLIRGMERAAADGFRGTDDAALVERLGARIVIIEGFYANIKITTPEDLQIAEILVKNGMTGDNPP